MDSRTEGPVKILARSLPISSAGEGITMIPLCPPVIQVIWEPPVIEVTSPNSDTSSSSPQNLVRSLRPCTTEQIFFLFFFVGGTGCRTRLFCSSQGCAQIRLFREAEGVVVCPRIIRPTAGPARVEQEFFSPIPLFRTIVFHKRRTHRFCGESNKKVRRNRLVDPRGSVW